MTASDVLPLIGVPACLTFHEGSGHEGSGHKGFGKEGFGFHQVGHKYVTGVIDAAGGLAVLIPAVGPRLERRALLDRLDGLLITGSRSNVEPHHYGGPAREGSPTDPARDATTLPLIRDALALGVPLFAICRGIQELNVALGGTLHQEVHALPGRIDHRSDKSLAMHERYAAAHRVALTPGGRLQALLGALLDPVAGGAAGIEVNSLHGQAIDRLAPGLAVEAWAPDGTIEAVSVEGARTFALGVQWHPEWRAQDNPVSARLFAAFGAACRTRAGTRVRHEHGAVASGA